MRILLAGVNSYVGRRLIPFLAGMGHDVICLVRDKSLFDAPRAVPGKVTTIAGDLLRAQTLSAFPDDIDAAFYLVNSLSHTSGFAGLEALCARNFTDELNKTQCKQVITLSGIHRNATPAASSRQHVEEILVTSKAALTVLRTTMVIGQGSMAMQLLNAITGKDTIIVSQNWLKAYSQPIFVNDVLSYLEACALNEKTYNRKFEIGGPDVLPLRQMILTYIAFHKRNKPHIITVPLLTPAMSSYLLNILAPVSYTMAKSIVEDLEYNNICRDNSIKTIIPRHCVNFKKSLSLSERAPEAVYN
ncbi:MAG: NAD(P)H-binding protein [Bacteroidetes bacterium]|nr:NAD(P)H-binding protein [Bacteroidota bacterium]